ncbi:MAG TPA: RDD family protein [Acidimicrobiia bacterium]|nr:RDD family protein [Acidimicrobiia bacterium]
MVDPDMVLDHIDINGLLDRVDINALLDRVDVDRLLERIDIDELLQRADIDAFMERVDVRSLVDRAGIPEIVAESTSHLTGSALDMFRRPIVGIDEITFSALNRLVRRDPRQFPSGPGALVSWVADQGDHDPGIRTGRYAGPVTRLIAVVLDSLIVTTGFTAIVAGFTFLVELITARQVEVTNGVWFVAGYVLWAFLYLWLSVAVFGKTLGKTVMGVRVVGADGSIALQSRQAFIRAITYPLSFAILGLGLVGVVFGRERRAWHDHLARTAVVYDWGSRAARMSTPLAAWLERKGSIT